MGEGRAVLGVARVTLRKPLEKSIRSGHPWVYADALHADKSLATGSIVEIADSQGRFLARGLYDRASPLAVRIYTLDEREPLDAALVERRLRVALAARRAVIDANTTNAFRWCNGEGDYLPGVVVDVYDKVAVVRLDGDASRVLRDQVVAGIRAAGEELRLITIYERSRGAKNELLFGAALAAPVEILEHDVRFSVDILHGQKTGFFLDQRDNRRSIRPFARARDAVNLFSYSGGFSVHAALGGATRVVSVDSGKGAIESAIENFRLNGVDPSAHEFACEDAFKWLDRCRQERRRFGLVVSDPPSFAPSEKALQRGLNAYRDLHAKVLSIVAPGGTLAAASCSSHVTMDAFVGTLRDAAVTENRRIRLLELRGQPGDHPVPPAFAEGRYLKFVLCFVE